MIALYLCANNMMKFEIDEYSPLPSPLFVSKRKQQMNFKIWMKHIHETTYFFDNVYKRNHFCHIMTYDDFPYRSRVMARRVKIDMLTVKQEVKELKLQVFDCSTFQISSFNVSSRLFVIFSEFQGHGFSFFCSF